MKSIQDIHREDFSRLCSHWFHDVCPRIHGQAKEDVLYQQLSADMERYEQDYAAIRDRLSPEDRDALSVYFGACQELSNRFAQLLYQDLVTDGAEREHRWLTENGLDPRDF